MLIISKKKEIKNHFEFRLYCISSDRTNLFYLIHMQATFIVQFVWCRWWRFIQRCIATFTTARIEFVVGLGVVNFWHAKRGLLLLRRLWSRTFKLYFRISLKYINMLNHVICIKKVLAFFTFLNSQASLWTTKFSCRFYRSLTLHIEYSFANTLPHSAYHYASSTRSKVA